METKIESELNNETWWQAVLNRDENFDGAWVYGVLSTRIFCRPSCPARRPKFGGARFFDSPEAASKAGFRACKRCRPEQFQSVQVARVEAACRLIEVNDDTPLSLEELAREVGGSAGHLQRTFKQVAGISPREYADARRLGELKVNLQSGETVLNARLDSGYGSSRGLYERAPSQLGMTPATYGRGGKSAQINFSVAPCWLGFLLVAATHKGVCSVALGDSDEELETALKQEFPAAEIRRDDTQLRDWISEVLQFLKSAEPHFGLPLDIQATAFQWRVWQVLRGIARGQTRTYSQVAEELGQPTASRAVARACATNPVALVIPCHRVVRGSGALAGYRWGIERKERLLAKEKSEAHKVDAP